MVREHSIGKPKPLSFESVWFYKLKSGLLFSTKDNRSKPILHFPFDWSEILIPKTIRRAVLFLIGAKNEKRGISVIFCIVLGHF